MSCKADGKGLLQFRVQPPRGSTSGVGTSGKAAGRSGGYPAHECRNASLKSQCSRVLQGWAAGGRPAKLLKTLADILQDFKRGLSDFCMQSSPGGMGCIRKLCKPGGGSCGNPAKQTGTAASWLDGLPGDVRESCGRFRRVSCK